MWGVGRTGRGEGGKPLNIGICIRTRQLEGIRASPLHNLNHTPPDQVQHNHVPCDVTEIFLERGGGRWQSRLWKFMRNKVDREEQVT